MRLQICKDESSWLKFANDWLQNRITKLKVKSVYLPAGDTPRPLYSNWEAQKPAFLDLIQFIQIDDVATGSKRGIFKDFFCKELPTFKNQIHFFDQGQEQADLALLGLGLNGHVAFHEPHIPTHFFSGCVRLSDETLKNLDLKKSTWGKTFGVEAFMKTKAILMIVRGQKKKNILNEFLNSQLTHLPSQHLLKHRDFTILTDFELVD
jgi:6-phosphogluconolactonase/glucosamine-6-phosphate isomerase/deaminase